MKIIVHECYQFQVNEQRRWIEEELKLPIFKEKAYPTSPSDMYQFFLIVMNEEDLSALQLKYPAGTFRNL